MSLDILFVNPSAQAGIYQGLAESLTAIEHFGLSSFIRWAAGFLEAEGSFIARKKRGNREVFTVQACQVEVEPLRALQRYFGGTLSWEKRIYRWRVESPRSIGVIFTLYSFLSLRRQIEIVDIIRRWRNRGVAHALKNKCPRGHLLVEIRPRIRRCRLCDNALQLIRRRIKTNAEMRS